MGLMDKVAAGIERFAEGADKAIDKGKTKVGELQIEMQMDGLAKKLGYLVFDFYRGREVDQALRQKILDDLSQMEDRLFQLRSEAAAKAEAEAQWKAQRAAQQTAQAGQEGQPGQGGQGAPASGAAPWPTGAAPGTEQQQPFQPNNEVWPGAGPTSSSQAEPENPPVED